MQTRRFYNGVKTLSLFVVLWVVVLALGVFVGNGQYLFLFAGLGVVGTAIGYWNSASLACKL